MVCAYRGEFSEDCHVGLHPAPLMIDQCHQTATFVVCYWIVVPTSAISILTQPTLPSKLNKIDMHEMLRLCVSLHFWLDIYHGATIPPQSCQLQIVCDQSRSGWYYKATGRRECRTTRLQISMIPSPHYQQAKLLRTCKMLVCELTYRIQPGL